MYAAVIIGLAVLLIPGGHCRPRATSSPFQGAVEVAQFLTTSTVHKRQNIRIGTCDTNQLQNIFANYPRDCVSSLTNLHGSDWHSKPEPNCINRSLQDYLPAEMWQPNCNILQSVRVVATYRYPKGFLQ